MNNGSVKKWIDPSLDEAILKTKEQYDNRITYKEASRIIGENHMTLMKKRKNIIVWSYP